MLWAYLLDEDGTGGFRGLLTARRGTPVPDKDWDEARDHLHGRITDLLHALDVRAGRDAPRRLADGLGGGTPCPCRRPCRGRAGRPDSVAATPPGTSSGPVAGSNSSTPTPRATPTPPPGPRTHPTTGPARGRWPKAVAERGRDRVLAREWSEALADFSTAARLGRGPGAAEIAAILHAAKNVGRGRADAATPPSRAFRVSRSPTRSCRGTPPWLPS
ncbi:hypothetical protein LV779_14580 [Streptomyces thinghirensis]|nr:hypothetical protein [Streptomyces thinghirensis]